MDIDEILPALIIIGAVGAALGLLLWVRPEKFARVRINLIWVSTLVAILILTFGIKLIELIEAREGGAGANTLEIVLSSLVGVGIGGLIAIAGQLVQDSGQGDKE